MNDLLNWELCIAYLDDCIRELQECREKQDRALENIEEAKEIFRLGLGSAVP